MGGRVVYTINTKLTATTSQEPFTATATVSASVTDLAVANNSDSDSDRVVIAANDRGCGGVDVEIPYARYSGGPILCTADSSLRAHTDVQDMSGGDLLYAAPLVHLEPGFSVLSGGRFYAGNPPGTAAIVSARPQISANRLARDPSDVAVTSRRYHWNDLSLEIRQRLERMGMEPGEAKDIQSDVNGQRFIFATRQGLLDGDRNGVSDVYLYDAASDRLRLLSHNPEGLAGNGPSDHPAIDALAERIVFQSEADDLVADDTNHGSDLFLADGLSDGLIRLTDHAAGDTRHPAIDAFGSRLLYDRTDSVGTPGVYDRINLDGAEFPLAVSSDVGYHMPAISADGAFIAYIETGGPGCVVHIEAADDDRHSQLDCPQVEGDTPWKIRFSDWGKRIEVVDLEDGGVIVAPTNPLY